MKTLTSFSSPASKGRRHGEVIVTDKYISLGFQHGKAKFSKFRSNKTYEGRVSHKQLIKLLLKQAKPLPRKG